MKTKTIMLLAATLFFGNANAQTAEKPEDTGVESIDEYVINCYDINSSAVDISDSVKTIVAEITGTTLEEEQIERKKEVLRNYKGQLIDLSAKGAILLETSESMPENAKSRLQASPLKIPKALKNIKNGTQTLKSSMDLIKTTLISLPNDI